MVPNNIPHDRMVWIHLVIPKILEKVNPSILIANSNGVIHNSNSINVLCGLRAIGIIRRDMVNKTNNNLVFLFLRCRIKAMLITINVNVEVMAELCSKLHRLEGA